MHSNSFIKTILLLLFFIGSHPSFSQTKDTLIVFQNDPLVFEKLELMSHRPCSKPRLEIHYKLIKPKNNTYYFIYNDKNQLVKEGTYTAKYSHEGIDYNGAFYDINYYFYRKNGNLKTVHTQKNGRNSTTEFYGRNNRLKMISYFDEKSGNLVKDVIYKKNKVTEQIEYDN
ncbi:hypothetical protein [Olleya sp. HaHaR_3_96]|uniref:hypothetical protein n=1 Tax=Olleya sp. HaHaR_3_96 TaxID=2745560 RepID=UPI001C4E7F9D|nr:hypothetical protein [Olleya sp. HaHaR_3_96]QXP58555.1 hypothetical protein H0I26_11565 [Olleya sp. HaHaR_3_96]